MLNDFKNSKKKLETVWNKNKEIADETTKHLDAQDKKLTNISLMQSNGTILKTPIDYSTEYILPYVTEIKDQNIRYYSFSWELTFNTSDEQLLTYIQPKIILNFSDNTFIYSSSLNIVPHDELTLAWNSEIIHQITSTQYIYKYGFVMYQDSEAYDQIEDFKAKINVKLMNPHIYY